MKETDSFATKVLWITHLLIVVILITLFFIPKSIVSEIATIHLYYTLWVALSQAFWGVIMMRVKNGFSIVCPLTTLMQYMRGYSPADVRNNEHSFIVEALDKHKIKLEHRTINTLMYVTLGLVVIRFLWLNY